MPINIDKSKEKIIENISNIQFRLNEVLDAKNLDEIEPILCRISQSKTLPSWFTTLKEEKRLPNLDGKTVGSVIEKLLVCVLEKYIFSDSFKLSISPAHGVDIPELNLGVKSPSTNYATSEPFFSAYERLLGNEYDAIILLTNYQEAKKITPFHLQILQIKYLKGTEIADAKLCTIAKSLRKKYSSDDFFLKKAIRFLAYVNQHDWEANCILKLFDEILINEQPVAPLISKIEKDFKTQNKKNMKELKEPLSNDSLNRLKTISSITPASQAIITVAENWVIMTQKDSGRYPNDNEWNRFLTSPLNGKIGMSFALQWRYNFGTLFKNK